jgi:RimJ/RimL family protein N-acetyltransferase/8-oxo-dGTP pyrophosphatase MutT (NUDIX family)
MSTVETTWDGLPIAPDNPRGAGVVVRRGTEFLLLHRHHNGPEYEGDWAWTSPSGARLPGEPVLTGAVRELHEETGLSGLDLRPVDLSAGWAVFATAVAPGTQVVIDPEHDRFEWLSFDDALARLAPESVVHNFQRGATVPLPALTFRPLHRDDFPAMLEWFAEPHVAQWFPGPATLAQAEAKYGPRIDGSHHVEVHVLAIDGTAAGYLQCYPVAAEPAYADDVADTEAIAIDYVIGVPALVGTGIGTQAIWAYLRDVVLPRHPAAPRILASPKADNTRSVRALGKAGFRRLGDAAIRTADGIEQQTICVLERARIFG